MDPSHRSSLRTIVLVVLLLVVSSAAYAGLLPSEVLVVYNLQHPYSESVARYYAEVRAIPTRNLCGVDTRLSEALGDDPSAPAPETYASLISQIENYLLTNFNPYPNDPQYYINNPGCDPIKAIVLCHGVPSQFWYGERIGSIDSTLPLLFQRPAWGNLPIRRYCDYQLSVSNSYRGKNTDFGAFRAGPENDLQQDSPPFRIVRFLSATTALAGAFDGVLYTGELSSGQWTWAPVNDEDKHFIGYRVSDIGVMDSNTAFVSTGDGIEGGTVLQTQDAGQTWTVAHRAKMRSSGWNTTPDIRQVSFQRSGVSGWVGWLVGFQAIRHGSSSDGTNFVWQDVTNDLLSNDPGKLGTQFNPLGIAMADTQNIWICGNNGIYRSSDGGVQWSQQVSGTDKTFYKVWMRWATDHFEGIAIGSKTVGSTSYAHVLFTQDGGLNWQEPISDSQFKSPLTDMAVFPAADGSYKIAMSADDNTKGYLYDSNTGWSAFTGITGMRSLAWNGVDRYLATVGTASIKCGQQSGGTISWTDSDPIPPMHWKLRYIVARLESLEEPLTSTQFGTMPRDVKLMIDRSLAAAPGGKFVFDGCSDLQQPCLSAELQALGVGQENLICDNTEYYIKNQTDVMAYRGSHMSDYYCSTYLYTTWGRPGHSWRPGGVTMYHTNDGQSFRTPQHLWGLGSSSTPATPGVLNIEGLYPSAQYTSHKIVLCTSPGGPPLSGGTTYFQSNGTTSLDLNGVTWPQNQGVYVEIRFPDDDPDPDLRDKYMPYGRVYWTAAAIPGIVSAGKRYALACAREVSTQYIREGASGTISAIDEPFLVASSYPILKYVQGYTWGESAFIGMGLGFVTVILGDPLMAPYAVNPAVAFVPPTPEEGYRASGSVTLCASALPDGVGSIDRVEFYAIDTSQNPKLLGIDYSAPYEHLWDTNAGWQDGTYTIRIVAHQLSDRVGIAIASRTLILDNSGNPTVTIAWPDAENMVVNESTPVTAVVSDPSMTVVQFWLLSETSQILAGEDTTAPYTCSISAATAPDGVYHLQAVAYNQTTSQVSFSSRRQIIVRNTGPVFHTIVEAASQADSTSLMLVNRPVVAGMCLAMKQDEMDPTDAFYLEDTSRCAGIRIESALEQTISAGSLVTITGVLRKDPASVLERRIEAAEIWVMGPSVVPKPLGMAIPAVGGLAPTGTPGIVDGVGLYNVGLLVQVWGRVVYVGDDFVYIDDGSGVQDGNVLEITPVPLDGSQIPAATVGVKGVRVYFGDFPKPGIDDYVSVRAISSIEDIGGNRVRLFRVADESAVTYYEEYTTSIIGAGGFWSLNQEFQEPGANVRLLQKYVDLNYGTRLHILETPPNVPYGAEVLATTALQQGDYITVTGIVGDWGSWGRKLIPNHIYLDSTEQSGLMSMAYGGVGTADDGKLGGGPFRPWPYPTAEETLASDWFKEHYSQVGAIGWALSQPDGSTVDLPGEQVILASADGKTIGLKEPFEPAQNAPKLLLLLENPVERLRQWCTIDIVGGTMTTLPNGQRAIVRPQAVYAYMDAIGRYIATWSKVSYRQDATPVLNGLWRVQIAP